MSKVIQYSDESMEMEVVSDFLPSPAEIAKKMKT